MHEPPVVVIIRRQPVQNTVVRRKQQLEIHRAGIVDRDHDVGFDVGAGEQRPVGQIQRLLILGLRFALGLSADADLHEDDDQKAG
ncbi:MAG TPA: hypothetical protein VFJ08_10330 [Salinisphaera sp.]|nr:hypothetical protein [Salinisphaera sp.]